jgi:hypothetical protein
MQTDGAQNYIDMMDGFGTGDLIDLPGGYDQSPPNPGHPSGSGYFRPLTYEAQAIPMNALSHDSTAAHYDSGDSHVYANELPDYVLPRQRPINWQFEMDNVQPTTCRQQNLANGGRGQDLVCAAPLSNTYDSTYTHDHTLGADYGTGLNSCVTPLASQQISLDTTFSANAGFQHGGANDMSDPQRNVPPDYISLSGDLDNMAWMNSIHSFAAPSNSGVDQNPVPTGLLSTELVPYGGQFNQTSGSWLNFSSQGHTSGVLQSEMQLGHSQQFFDLEFTEMLYHQMPTRNRAAATSFVDSASLTGSHITASGLQRMELNPRYPVVGASIESCLPSSTHTQILGQDALDHIASAQPRAQSVEMTAHAKRAPAFTGGSEQQSSMDTTTFNSNVDASGDLKVVFYRDPITESKEPKVRKSTRAYNGKVKRACFICKRENRRVRVLDLHYLSARLLICFSV